MSPKLKALSELMDMQLKQKMSELQRIERDQQQIRNELSELASLGHTRFDGASDVQARVAAGADSAWHVWATQRQTQLNGQLALLAAERLTYLDEVRHAFARDQAAQGLVSSAALQRAQATTAREAESLIALVITNAAKGRDAF